MVMCHEAEQVLYYSICQVSMSFSGDFYLFLEIFICIYFPIFSLWMKAEVMR